MNTSTPLTDLVACAAQDKLPLVSVVGAEFARTLERELSAKSAECQRLRALVQDAYDDPDSEILGEEWNDAARAALQEVQP